MFGKKSVILSEKAAVPSPTSVQTMPADFYGGVNPVVKFKKVEKEIVLDGKPELTESEKRALDKSLAAGTGDSLHAVNILTNRKYSVIFWSALFILSVGGAGIYYYFQSKNTSKLAVIDPPSITLQTTTSESEVVVPTTTETATVSTPTAPLFLPDAPIEFPSYLLGDSSDVDRDNIADMAEELFGTDPGNPDSDADTHDDGHEVFYLYNPAGKEPVKLVDSEFIQEFRNPSFGYSLLYPKNWALGVVDADAREVLFSTLTGENIEIRTFDLEPQQTFSDWFTRWAPEQNYQNLVDFQTRFLEVGKGRNDNLVYYFSNRTHVFVLVYHTTDSSVVNYKAVLVMMARSFRTAGWVVPENLSVPATSTYPGEMPSTTNTTL